MEVFHRTFSMTQETEKKRENVKISKTFHDWLIGTKQGMGTFYFGCTKSHEFRNRYMQKVYVQRIKYQNIV